MTHDFAKKPKATPKKKKAAKKATPGWVWLLSGIVIGVLISVFAYLADFKPAAAPQEIAETVEEVKEDAKNIATKFDFYTLLPEREVIVPVERDERIDQPKKKTAYMLQAGSFKSASDADRLRAKLLLMGLDAKVEQASTSSGETWHRVQVGPFPNTSRLSKARTMLLQEGIEAMVYQRKAKG